MTPAEARAAGVAAARAFAGAVGHVQATHRAVAARAFGRGEDHAGWAPPVAWAHDRIADGTYAAVRGIGSTVLRAAGLALAATRPPHARPLGDHPAGDRVLGALGGAFGDRWAAERSPLALPMTLRRNGRDLPVDGAALRRAFPMTTGRVVVLVHGLCLTDASWAGTPAHEGFAARLHRDLGADVLLLRYDTGRRIPANGADLANLLERLVAAWPGGLRELSLVGHSMGGLVARAACVEGAAAGHGWIGPLRHVVTLGSPHLGAHLERASATASWAAGLAPETRLVTDLLGLRSAGVLDLRHGAIVPEDLPPAVDRWPWGERGTAVPLLEGVRHHALGVTMAGDPASWLARTVLGDLLVTPDSATGRARGERRLAYGEEDAVLLGGLHHFDLLHHPRVYAQLRRWLRPAPGLPAPGTTGDGLVAATALDA
ncbi:hypothetical protein [Patulibacter sp. SYSU D01012]|uniref:PGAP1-like alpha/beta domain-containing protein n=1 Tax=Patulibacter sp. SYSU D01012 TaxID=2817381 RepID=UPI001B30A652|nr:hypothetical protein [Patulibacter sp. SYSU D01012]